MRTRVPAVAVLIALLLTVVAAPATAGADPDAEAAFAGRLNAARVDAGLAPLAVVGDLTAVARAHAARMADADHLHHNPALTSEVNGWQKVGENVGRGPSVEAIHAALWDSPSHRANLLDPAFTEVGVGVDVRDGHLWVVQVFRLPEPQPEPPAPPHTAAVEPAHVEVAGVAVDAPPPAPAPAAAAADGADTLETTPVLDQSTIVLARLEAAEQAVALTDLLDR